MEGLKPFYGVAITDRLQLQAHALVADTGGGRAPLLSGALRVRSDKDPTSVGSQPQVSYRIDYLSSRYGSGGNPFLLASSGSREHYTIVTR